MAGTGPSAAFDYARRVDREIGSIREKRRSLLRSVADASCRLELRIGTPRAPARSRCLARWNFTGPIHHSRAECFRAVREMGSEISRAAQSVLQDNARFPLREGE